MDLTRLPIMFATTCLLLAGCVSTSQVDPVVVAATAPESEAEAIARLRHASERFEKRPFVPGNAVSLLRDGPSTYAALLRAIDGAKRRIDMESYQFDTRAAPIFAAALIHKARQNVAVHLIYDSWGSMSQDSALFDQMREAGVQVLPYNPLGAGLKFDIDLNRRDHRKLLVVDDRIVITGGVNVTGVYLNPKGTASDDPDHMAWRDTDVEITGPVVAQFAAIWAQTWDEQHGPALPPGPATPATPRGPTTVQAIDGAPVNKHAAIYETLLAAFALAKTSIHLTSGFFVPPPDMNRALKAAARRGVDVAVIVPGQSDSDAARDAGRADYTDLLAAGVRIYERQDVVLHAKTAVVDGMWSTVGSSNLDWRSTTLNKEIDAAMVGAAFGGKMEAMFRDDIAGSKRITREAWARRGLGERVKEGLATLIARLL